MPADARRLLRFVAESNAIEGIHRDPTVGEIDAHDRLLAHDSLDVDCVVEFVDAICGAPLRDRPGMNVRVGAHLPPPGGFEIHEALDSLLGAINCEVFTPFEAHVRYESIHPFMDGNGRSGRAIWAWQMLRDGRDPFALSFKHRWYYDSLDATRRLLDAR